MTRLVLAVLALLPCGCGPLLIEPDLETAVGKVMVVWIGDGDDVARRCATEFRVPGSVACVSMSRGPEEAADMLERWSGELRRRGAGIDCIMAVPASMEALGHEITLCGKQPAWYWNKAAPAGG